MNTLKRLTFITLLIAGASILYMIYKLADTKYIVTKNLVEKTYTNSKYGLIGFFEPISHQLEYTAEKMEHIDRKSTRLNSSHVRISYAVFCLKKKKKKKQKK